ncbi:MAG: glycosyltransferase family 39 protein [Polyangiaceae bacterium]|nr:glycosyltransferase family 39 protein [Polyangiaceae bacterium]
MKAVSPEDCAGATPTRAGIGTRALAVAGPLLAVGVVLGSLFGPIGQAGLWDPVELRVAELARRLAIHVLGAGGFVIDGADNTMMTRGALGSGELPYASIATGFWIFGLHDWAGRLPLALWALLGVVAIWMLVARLGDRRAATYAAVVLATTPLYFVHARTLLGDAVTLALHAVALAGLGVATFAGDCGGRFLSSERVFALLVGGLALVGGYFCRGAMLGLAVPALSVGLAWLLAYLGGLADGRRGGSACGILVLAAGIGALVWGGVALGDAWSDPGRFYLPAGARVAPPVALPTFDAVLGQLGQGLFPYSGLALIAVGGALAAPLRGDADSATGGVLRLLLVSATGVAIAAHGALAPTLGTMPFVAVSALAALIALWVRDLERRGTTAPAAAMGIGAATVLVLQDRRIFPEKAFEAYGLAAEGLTAIPVPSWFVVASAAAAGVSILLLLAAANGTRPRFAWAAYTSWTKELRSLYGGNLFVVLLAVEATLVGVAALLGMGGWGLGWIPVPGIGGDLRYVAAWAWVGFPLLLVGVPSTTLVVMDMVRWVEVATGLPRARMALTAFVGCAALSSIGYYPALAATVSPRGLLATYRERAGPGEELAVLGIDVAATTYYLGTRAPSLESTATAFSWLTGSSSRRYLAVHGPTLAELNGLFRSARRPGNIPVIEAESRGMMLLSDRLGPGEKNQNPLDAVVLDAAPTPRYPMDANLGGVLDVIGWEVTDVGGRLVEGVVPRKGYEFRIYWRVVGRVTGDWQTFIHIDGQGRRHNGDHATLAEKYPYRFWRPGDVIVDAHPFNLEPNFSPGEYDVYFGLFEGNRRLEVVRGRHRDDRLVAGKLRVR